MTAELITMAREAGRQGKNYADWTGSDEVQALVDTGCEFDSGAIEAAFCDGRQEYRVKSEGWIVAWTTAPSDYDTGETEHAEDCGDYHGKKLRRIIVHARHLTYQSDRNFSGLHPTWEEDPRIADARAKSVQEERDARRAEHDAKRKAGLEWLATAPDIDDDDNFDLWESKGLRYDDVRAERKRRQENAATIARDAEWARCVALVPEHVTIVDNGTPGTRGIYGWIPGRPTHVWYDVRIVRGWPDDADHATVRGEKLGDSPGSLAYVAKYLTDGTLRIARPEEKIPPSAVLDRIGHEHLREIRYARLEGSDVWVGRATFGEPMVLNSNGRIVRAKKIREAALRLALLP